MRLAHKIVLLLGVAQLSTTVEAAPTIFSNKALFSAQLSSAVTNDLNSLGNAFYGSPGSIALGNLTLQTTSPLFSQATNQFGTGTYLSAQQANPITLTFNFSTPQNAFGFDFTSAVPLSVGVNAATLMRAPSFFPNLGFVGIIDTVGFTNVTVTIQNNGIDTDNIITSNALIPAVPEPASWTLMLLGFGAAGFAMRHRRRQQPNVQLVF